MITDSNITIEVSTDLLPQDVQEDLPRLDSELVKIYDKPLFTDHSFKPDVLSQSVEEVVLERWTEVPDAHPRSLVLEVSFLVRMELVVEFYRGDYVYFDREVGTYSVEPKEMIDCILPRNLDLRVCYMFDQASNRWNRTSVQQLSEWSTMFDFDDRTGEGWAS